MILYPKGYFSKVSEISLEYLKENNIKGLILDVDNTLIDYYRNMVEEMNYFKDRNIEIKSKLLKINAVLVQGFVAHA